MLAEDSAGRDADADGRACTFLPLVPEAAAGTTATATLALGMQLRRPTVRSADGTLRFLERWHTTFAEGRLRRLLDLGATAGGRPLTWVVDPALLDTAESVARGNPAVGLAPPPAAGPDPGADEGGDPGGDEEDGGDAEERRTRAEEEPAPDDEPAAEETPEQAAARDWLTSLAAELAGSPVMALPYGDLDAAAVVRRGFEDQLVTAQEASAAVLETWEVSSTPALVPPSGLVPEAVLGEIGPETTAVVRPVALPETVTGPVLERTDGGRLLVAQPDQAVWGPGPGPRRSALAVRQRLLADAALHALSGADEPLVRLLPRWWDPGPQWRRARFFGGLDVPWLAAGGLGQALSAPVAQGSERVGAGRARLPGRRGRCRAAVRHRRVRGPAAPRPAATWRSCSPRTTSWTRQGRQALLYTSVWSRPRPRLQAARAAAAEEIVDGWLGKDQRARPVVRDDVGRPAAPST